MSGIKLSKFNFSPNLSNGSIQKREKLAERFNEHVFQRVSKLYEHTSEVPIRELERSYRQCIPEHKPIVIKKILDMDDDFYGNLMFIREFKDDGYVYPSKFAIEITAKKNKLHKDFLPTFMHESLHFFDFLLLPKHQLRYLNMDAYNLNDITIDLYKNYYYKSLYKTNLPTFLKLKQIKYITKKKLKNLTPKEQLVVLQFIKGGLECERHAYDEMLKYTEKMKGKIKPIYDKDSVDSYCFDKKIKMVKRMIYKIIMEERAKNTIKTSQKPKDIFIAYRNLLLSKFF